MPAGRTAETDIAIRPLTFLQTLGSIRMIPLLQQQAARPTGFLRPIYHHLATSGYGAYAGDELAGWIYLQGHQRMLTIQSIVVREEQPGSAIGDALLGWAEASARELRHRWLGLILNTADEATLSFFEQHGYRRGHWRIMRLETAGKLPESGGTAYLRPLAGRLAGRAYYHFAGLDLAAGDAPADSDLAWFLMHDRYHHADHNWTISCEGQPAAYLSHRQRGQRAALYLASGPDWWDSEAVLEAALSVVRRPAALPAGIDLRLGSSGHHDAARAALEQWGFVECPASFVHLFKCLSDPAG